MNSSAEKSQERTEYPIIATPPATGNIDIEALDIDGDFSVVDVETTGIDPAVDKIIEIGITRRRGNVYERFTTLINPGFSIPPTCSAVTHLTDEDVANAPTLEQVTPQIQAMLEGSIPVAHNAGFDALFVDPIMGVEPDAENWLCTLRGAKHLMPLAPAFGNQVLRYWLKTKPESGGLGAHRAMDDVHVTFETLGHVLRLAADRGLRSIADVRDFVQTTITIDVMPFGKHAHEKLIDIPLNYYEWAFKNLKDLDRDLKVNMERTYEKLKAGTPASPAAGAGDPNDVICPFKAHQGKPLSQVPTDYLKWMTGAEFVRPPLRDAALKVIEQRSKPTATSAAGSAPAAAPAPAAASRSSSTSDAVRQTFGASAKQTPAPQVAPGATPTTAATAAPDSRQRRSSMLSSAQGVIDLFGGDDMQEPANDAPGESAEQHEEAPAPAPRRSRTRP
ncbi:exonuclease domain-containing protein [Hydrogenophaga sp. 2FB]|uniref:exonuclease domain-containing protein n=1 Tax=Hydrogenophaga sp. 2FB TaxID=2502187 RepID=UPI0010F8B78C|nr:exonuclease domain-containing protein [Hydrogenophaga sp. 2FB]